MLLLVNLFYLLVLCREDYSINAFNFEKVKRSIFILVLLLTGFSVLAKDTLKVMHYNLLYYDKNTTSCTSSNNNVSSKDSYLTKIVNHVKPDIFTANEINGSSVSVQRVLNNALNVNGVSKYAMARYSGSSLVNMLYYNTEKLVLKSQAYIQTSPRLTDVYRLYYKSPELANGDTAYITCVVTHLKAGSDYAYERGQAAQTIMSYLRIKGITENVLLMGDMNMYTASEPAFVSFTSTSGDSFRFFDPVNEAGDWNNNFNYRYVHTQSTHTSGSCHAGGGMDDRFDFILASPSVLNATGFVGYVPDSYWAVGQDGQRFNGSLLSPANSTVPTDVLNALYYMSDHLPVTLKLAIDQSPATAVETNMNGLGITAQNPVSDFFRIRFADGMESSAYRVEIYSVIGNLVYSANVNPSASQVEIPTGNIAKGIYLIRITGSNGQSVVKKVLKN